MEKLNSSGSRISLKGFGVLAVILKMFGILLIGNALGHFVLKEVFHINFSSEEQLLELIKTAPNPQSIILKSQGVNALFTFFLLPISYIIFFKRSYIEKFNPVSKRFMVFLFLAVVIFFTGMPLLAYLVEWNKAINLPSGLKSVQAWMEKSEHLAKVLTETIIYYEDNNSFFVVLLIVAILPGIGEELLFRGIVQNEIQDILKSPTWAIWITGFLFSFIHFQFFGFFPRMLLGVLFGYFYYWSGNIYVSMFVHFMNNALSLVLANMYKQKAISFDPDSVEFIPVYSVIISIITFAFFVYLYKRISTEAGITK
jgi:membrane protease YdiL (CAAX protease family)